MRRRKNYSNYFRMKNNYIITWDELKKELLPMQFDELMEWMRGQTCLKEGIFRDDYERWMKGLPVVD